MPRALLLLNLSRGVAVEMSCVAASMPQSDRPDLLSSVEFDVLMPQSNPLVLFFFFFLFLLPSYGIPGP